MKIVKKCLALFLCGMVAGSGAFAADKEKAAAKPAAAKKTQAAASKNKAPAKQAEAAAAVAVKDDTKKTRRIVEGSVVHVGKRAISVEYEVKGAESYEMLLPLAAKPTLEGGIKSLVELKYGDRVKVGIEQTYKDNPDGTTTMLKTEALVVALIQRAPEATTEPTGSTADQ